MAERPLYTLYKNLKAQNYDVPDDYNKFESALTRDGKGGADNRHAIYENLKAQNFDVPSTYERFYSALFEPRSRTSSRAKGGSVPMSAADRARFSAGAAAISASAQQTMNNAGRYNRLKQRKQKQQKDFGRVNLGTHQTPYGGDANNVVKDDFAYNPETGKTGAYVTSDNENVYSLPEAEQMQAILDKQNDAYQVAVDTGEIPSAFDVRDKNGNYDLQENIGKNGTYLTEEGAQKQFDKKLADAYARKKEIEAAIAEDHRLHGNPLLSYGASIGASNGRTAEQSDYSNKLATSLALVKQQIGALEAVKQYPTSSWGEDALKALDNTAFTAKTWDFGLTDFATMGQMERIKTKMDNNIPLSGSDKMLLKSKLGADAAAALEDEKMGNVYRWTKIAGQSLPFMADFFLTGGYGGITKGISRGALKIAAKRGMGKVGAAILKNTGIVAGDVIGSYAMAGTEQALKTGADIMQRHLGNLYQDEKGDYKFGTFDENGNLLHEGGVSIGTALYKGMTSAMVENYIEKLFGHNYGIKKGAVNFMEKHGMNASAEFFKNIGKSGWYTNSKKWMGKFGINGFAEEVMEEEIGIPLHALLDGEGKVSDLLDAKQQLDIIGGMAISVGSMYAMGAGSRPVKGIYNRAQYYRFRNKVNVADSDAQNLMGDNWADIKDKIDSATNEQMGGVLADILRQRDTMTKEQINAAVNYGVNLMKMRGYNIAKTAEMNAREITNEPTTPEEQHQADIDNAYSEGHDADDADKHDIQIQQEDQMKTLAAALGISEQQLSAMSDDELESLTGQDDKLDQAIYDYQLSSARYQGVVDDAQDKVDLAAHQAEQRVDMYTDLSRGSVRNATIKASGGLEDYGVYIISGNIATHDDGSIDVSNSDDMILYFDPTTNSVEHADALMFAELGEELPADDVKAQAVADAKENAIKDVAGIIDGTIEVGSLFNVTDTDGTEHTYEVLADYGDGTAAISIDGNVVENPYSFADLQQMKDLEDQKRLEAAKAEREQMEKERAAQQTQETEQTEETQPSFDFNQILNDDGNVVLVDVLGKDGNTKYPDSKLFLIRDTGAKAKVVELKSDGTIVPHAVNKEDVATISSMSLDEYKQTMAESSMIEDNRGENRGEIEVEAPTIEGETAAPAEETPATEQTPVAPAITLEDGTIVPMLEDGNPDFSKLTAAQTAELYDTQFGEDADSIVSGYVSDAKKALDKASNMTVKGKTFVEQKAAKDDKEKAIADAQAAYDSAIAIRDAYNERQLAKVEDTAEGRKELIEKARRKFARLKSAVKDDAEAVSQLYRETIGSLLHRLYDSTGIDVTDTTPLTAEEYVASNLGAHSLNYEGTETSKGVKQETGLSREDFAKTQLLAADGKGTTIDALVHSLWENRPSNLESLDTQDIRNALIGVLNSGFKASEARNFVENIRIAQAENILEEQKRAQENAAYAEQHKAEPEAELKAKSDEKAELKAKSEAKLDNESDNKSNDLSNESDNEQKNDNINDNINVPEDATDEAPLGAQRDESDLPFSAKENGKQQTTAERAADVEKNKVDDMKVVDNIVGEKTRKAFERLAKMMGSNIQWQYSDKLGNGWIQETTDADGNVHRTIFITLDSSITEGAQFIFGHEMTHQIKNLNPAAYNELTQLVLDTYGSDAFDKAVDETMKRYSDAGFSGRARDYYAEEVVADSVGEMIRDLNLAHTLAMKMSHPLLAAIHEILKKIKLAFFGTEYSDVTKNIIRSIEQAYVKTANGQVTNSETGEDVSFSLRQKPEPKKKGIGYKVFVLKDGKLYPPMVANPDGAATPVGVWLDADAAPIAGESKTGRPQVKQGGKGTQGGSGKLAYRPGWHLGVVPYAIQFNRKDAEGNKTLFPKNFVFAEVEYAADVDYQEEARQEGINPSGKYQHSLAGLKHLPTDGYYMYRTNPNPETDPWVITGAMKVNRILTRAEQAELVKNAGREPQQIQEGDIVTDDVVNSINQEIAAAPKFSLKVYHGSGADFTEFDFDHMGEGAGSQAFGWGGYVTSSEEIGKSYVELTRKKPTYVYNGKEMSEDDLRSVLLDKVGIDNANILDDFLYNLEKYGVSEAKSILRKGDYAYFKDLLKGTYGSIRSGYQNKVDAAELILAPRNIRVKKYKGNLYEVDIPDDNGNNYLDWDAPITDELIDKVAKALPSLRSYDIKDLKKDRTFDNFYKTISMRSVKDDAAFNDDKAASKLLASLGYTGIKYKAGRNFGGAEEGDTNYVIFKPEDMKITEHTKFSLKTYHGTGANFDRFDTSHAYEGAGSETFGHGIYVTKSAKIGASYALKAKVKKIKTPKAFKAIKNGDNWFGRFIDNAVRSSFAKSKKETFNRMDELIKEDENIVNDETKPEWKKNAAQKELADFDKLKSLFEGLTEEDIPSLKRAKANRYEVEIPDDTGNNYLDWNKPMNKEQKKIVREGLEKLGVDVDRLVRNGYSLDKNFGDVYNGLLYYALNGTKFEERDSFVASSNFLSSLGFTGIKYYAGTIWGGAKKGDLNYVIFNEDDAKIVGNTKFSLKKVNDAFNQRLDELVKNPNQKDKILHLGRSSSFLKAGGITDAEIELDFDKFIRKSGDKYKNNHPFAASDLINLPMALAEPIAVFNSTTANDHVVLTELQKDGKNFIVAVRAVEQHRKGGVVLEVNKITSLYPKEERGIVYWINNGRISNVDKEKALHFIEALQPHAGTTITDEELKSAANIINSFETTKGNGEKVDVEAPKTFDEFLNHPSLKFSIKNGQQRKAAEDAYEYAFKLRPNKSSQYALVDMSNPSNSPQYYEKKVLADRWRRFYNKAVHNELDDVYKDAWGNYKLFDLDRPFDDQVNEVKGDVPSEFNAPDVVANKNADNESGAEYHEYKQDEPSSITYKDRYKAFKQREANREKTAGLRKERKEVEDVYKSKSEERVEYNKQLMKEYMDEHGLSSENDIPYDVWDNLRSKSFEKYQDELDSLFNKYKDLDKQIKAVAEPRFSLKDEKIKSVAEKFGVNEDDVAMYANAVEKGSTAEAARARANIKRYLLQANEDKISSFKELMKYTVPVNESLKENFGDLDAMIEEQRKQVEAERNAMEAARKRAQEEEEKRQKHLDELSLIPTDELDKRYMDAIANNDESTAREMLDESARRKGYGDVDSDYQGQGAWAAPSNPQYESDEARRADIENSPDVNLEDIALGYSLQPDDYFDNPRAYMNNTAYGLESAHVIKNALDAIKNGEKDVKVKVYRAVPTSVKEGKLRNGDWVTPSKKYAEMHGDNRLEGKYRIIEDEVPANQLWWDGNDANEFGFDDGKEYRYKNAKNNRKLNDLITYDNKGNVIPPSKRFNSRKNDIRFSLRDMADGKESGAADMAEDLKSLNTPDEVDDAIKTAIEDMPSGWKMANKKMIHIAQALGENRKAEIAGEEPKFSLKDGTLIKAGTYFSGGGLVEEGLKGIIDPVVAVEYDEKISGVYRNNFGQHIVTADVRDVDPRELVKQIDGEVEYFHASPVCKNYSQAKSNHAEVELDKETAASTAEFINAVKPKVVTIENVKGYKDSEAMKTITDALDANGYTWDADVYNAADYGGYTNRERLIVRAVRDGKLPEKPKKMAHKSGWYEAVADIIPTLTEKKNGVAPWMDIRLKADGIDWRNIDKPLYVMGSAYADGKVPHAFADELLPTLRTKSGDVIVMPDGKVYRAMGRVLARVSGVSDDYKMPFSENLSHTIIGNGIPTQLTEHVIAPLLTGSDPKFSIRTYHGTGASFDKFDFSHMGEGEGSQAFGWGGYVTNSKDIAEDYTRRAKIRKDNGGFEFVTDMSANNKDMVRQYIYKYKDVNKGLNAMRKDLSSALEMFPDDKDLKELSDILEKKNEEIAVPDNIAYLYDVDIPDDNGDYLDWDAPLTDKQKNTIIKELRRLKIDFADFKKRGFSFDGSFGGNAYDFLMYALRRTKKWKDVDASRAVSKFLSSIGFTGIKYKAGTIFGGAKEGDYNYVIFDENNANIVGNTRFSLRYDQFEHDLNQWKKDNNLPKDAQRPTIPQRNAGESAVDFLRRVDEYRKQMALWKTAPTYEQHLLSDDTALGEFNRELQKGSVLKRIAFQDSMLAIRKAQEAIMKEVGVDRLNMAEDAYTAENRSHGKGKNEFEEYNNEFLQPLRKAYHQMKKILGDSYDNVRIYMMAKHGLERDSQMAFKKSLEADYEDVAQRSAAYKAYKGDMNRIINDSDLEFGRVDFNTWRQRDNALRAKYSPSYMDYRYDKNGIAYDYSGLSALFDGSDFEEAAYKLVKDIEDKYVTETHTLWDATNAATKKIIRDGYKAGMMSKDTYQYVRDMYSHYIPLRGWDGTTADQVWDYVGGGKGVFNQTLKKAHGRTSIADDPIAYIENMAESGILLNNKNWVKQHLMLLAQNHPTSLLTLSKAWYVKSTDANGNEEWIPATPQITSQMDSNQVKAAIDAFEKRMEKMAQTGDATQKRDGLNIAYPQTHSEEREHEVRVMKDGEEYVIYVNGDPQLAQAMNNTRAHRVREIQSGKLDRAAAWLGRKMAAAYTSLSPLFIPSNYFRDLTMTLASTAIREDAKYNYLLRKNLATSWNLGFMLRDYQSGKLREKVSNGNATQKEQMFYDFMMNGGETGFVSSLDVEDLKKKFKNDLKDLDRWKTNPVKVGHTIMDSIEFLNRAIEDSNRFAVYMTSIQYGRSIDEAVNDAKDVTLNFNRKGTGEHSWQTIRNLYLFINPAVQSLQTLGALAKHHPFKFTAVTASWLASGVLVPIVNVALMQLGAAFLGGDGDDDKDWYKDISKKYWQFSKWDRRNNFIMWVPTTHEFVKIPLAQEFRAFYGLGDMIASKMMGGELAEESWEDYGLDLVGQVVDMLPLDPTGYDGNIAVSLMPNAIRPVFELAFNVDFTGKPLFKDTEYNKYDPNFTKAYVGTPDWLVRASRMMNSIGNDYPNVQQNKWDALGDPRYNLNNPAVVDHVLSSYLGGAYTMGSQVLGLLTKSLNDRKEIKVADIPLVSKFVSNPDDRPVSKKQGDEFWDKKEYYDRASNTISKLKKQAKIDGDYSLLERFYGSEEYKTYKLYEKDVKDYKEARKKERAEESGDEYRPHQLNAEDIYNNHATPMDEFEDMKLKQLFEKLNSFKTRYDSIVDNAPNESDGYYNTNKAAIDAIDEISLDKQEISELKKGFLDDGKDAYNAEDMKQIRDLRKKILAVLEKANKVVVANQKAKTEK